MIKNKILKKLENKFGENNVMVYDESKKHNLYNRKFSHFKIIVISDQFTEKSLIIRHKYIYSLLLNSIYKYNIHGISIHTYTKNEFINIKNNDIVSPNCIKKYYL
jgi:BolA family transcriptional regulator, general stress-responsive regulator